KYAVALTVQENGKATALNFSTQQVFTTANLALARADKPVDSEYTVGPLFSAIAEKKEFSIVVNGGNPAVVHTLLEAKTNKSAIEVDMTLLRDKAEIERLSLSGVKVVSLTPVDNAAYIANFKATEGTGVSDSTDPGLRYFVVLWQNKD